MVPCPVTAAVTAAVSPELVRATVHAALASHTTWAGILSALATHKLRLTAAVVIALVAATGVAFGVLGGPEASERVCLKSDVPEPAESQAVVNEDVVGQRRPAPAITLPLTRKQANALVKELYSRILEVKEIDEDGPYVEELITGKRTPLEVAWMMASSKEYEQKFLTDRSPEDVIQTLYAKLFQREPSNADLRTHATLYWLSEWRVTVHRVLTDDAGQTYAGTIPWAPLDDTLRTVSRWATFADHVQQEKAKEQNQGH
jgi:hypothetical protein